MQSDGKKGGKRGRESSWMGEREINLKKERRIMRLEGEKEGRKETEGRDIEQTLQEPIVLTQSNPISVPM